MNIMMNADGLFPRGYHPQHLDFLPDMADQAPHVPRLVARPSVKYYYVDFGVSSQFASEESTLVIGRDGLDREAPELSQKVPYDAFKVDVFIIGNVLRKQFLTVSRVAVVSCVDLKCHLYAEILECGFPLPAGRVDDPDKP